MRSKALLAVGLLLVLGFVNVQIYRHEKALGSGHRVVLQLQPRDPRSLLQGDYMELRYKLADHLVPFGGGGVIYLKPDSMGLAREQVPEATPGAVPLKYRVLNGRVVFDIESYFFQEGTGSRYEAARYVELRVSPEGTPRIVRLLDSDLNEL